MFAPRRTLYFAAVLCLGFTGTGTPSNAQTPEGPNITNEASQFDPAGIAPSQFLIEPETQIQGDNIKRKTYRSQPAGENQNWNLDIGRFQPPINEDPNQVAKDLEDNYSGVRLRLPLRGRTGQ